MKPVPLTTRSWSHLWLTFKSSAHTIYGECGYCGMTRWNYSGSPAIKTFIDEHDHPMQGRLVWKKIWE